MPGHPNAFTWLVNFIFGFDYLDLGKSEFYRSNAGSVAIKICAQARHEQSFGQSVFNIETEVTSQTPGEEGQCTR